MLNSPCPGRRGPVPGTFEHAAPSHGAGTTQQGGAARKVGPMAGARPIPDEPSLRCVPVLAGLAPPDLERCRRRMVVRIAEASAEIVQQGATDAGDVFFLLDGRAQMRRRAPNGRGTVVVPLQRGELFGDMAAFGAGVRSATVVALSTCRLAVMPRVAFLEEVSTTPELSLALLHLMAERLKRQTDRLLQTNGLQLRRRLVGELMRHARPSDGRLVIGVPPRHADLAEILGARRESVSREFGRLAAEGLLRRCGRALVADDAAAFAALAGWDCEGTTPS